jgi:protein kinase-like protein
VIGREIGNYRITRRLGQGGVGEVFAGVDQMLNRPVAVKALRAEFGREPGVVARFRGEAENLARLNHPNIATLYSLQREGDELFMIMELVQGQTLEALLANRRWLSEPEALAITAQALDGLAYAHGAGVIHRDIKTGNLMVAPSGLLKIMDFGIARVRGAGRLTRQGHIVGTLAYMSPEQIQGEEGDERSDLYSLAVVLYELLSGDPPFVSDSEYALIRAQVETAPPRLIGRVSGVRPEIENALMRALAKHPADRFASAAEFGRALGVSDLGGRAVDVVRQGLATVALGATRTEAAAPAASLHGRGDAPGRPAAGATRLARSGEDGSLESRVTRSPANRLRRRSRALPAAALAVAAVMAMGVVAYTVLDLTPGRTVTTRTDPFAPPPSSGDARPQAAGVPAVAESSIPSGTEASRTTPETLRSTDSADDHRETSPSSAAAGIDAADAAPSDVNPSGSRVAETVPTEQSPEQVEDRATSRAATASARRAAQKKTKPKPEVDKSSGWQIIRE